MEIKPSYQTFSFLNTLDNTLVAIDGGVTFSGGNPILKLYRTSTWHWVKDILIARKLQVSVDIAKEIRYDFGYRKHNNYQFKHPDAIRDHADFLEMISNLKHKDQDVIIKVPVESITIDPTRIK